MIEKFNLNNPKLLLTIVALVSIFASFLIGILVGSSRGGSSFHEPVNSYYARLIKDDLGDVESRDFLQNEIKSENVEANLKYLIFLT
jgi:hypothetical protein